MQKRNNFHMSFLNRLPTIGLKKKKRIGRGLGSGKGAKSGRGITRHQKSKVNIPLHFEGGQARLVKKYPLLRGKGKNKSIKTVSYIINLDILNTFKDGSTVDRESLVKARILKASQKNILLKVLSKGKLEKKLTVKLAVSESAKKLIEKVGGKVVEQ